MIVGVDIGTSITKAALIGRDGVTRESASQPSSLSRLGGGRVEQDLEDVIGSVATVVRKVLATADETVEAIAITGQGDGLWLRDEAGRATRAPISWLDARASDLVRQWSTGGAESVVNRVFQLTGSGVFPGSHAALLAHLSEYEPDSLERAAVAGYCVDSVLQRITGVMTVDASDASLPFLDVTTRTYVDAALDLCGVSEWRHLLAAPAPPHAVHRLDANGATMFGLPEGTPVTAGPYDLQACGFGAGTTRLGEGTVVVGTTLSCQVLTEDASVASGSEPAGMWLCTPEPSTYLHVMPSMVGTASLDWTLNLIGERPEGLDRLLAESSAGSSGVRALSFLSHSGERAPFVDPNARGQFTGVDLGTSRADIVRSMCEAIAYAARHCFDNLGLDSELAGCGGGLKSTEWAHIFADVMGRPLHLPTEDLVGVRGAAYVAWESLGAPVDIESWRAQRRIIEPRAESMADYESGYRDYLDTLSNARESWRPK